MDTQDDGSDAQDLKEKPEKPSFKKTKQCRASKAKWTAEEDQILTRTVLLVGENNWKKVAQALSDRSHLQCLHRWQKVLNPALVKGPWKDLEDKKLVELVEEYGAKDWSTIASFIQGRIGKQCRERWFNHLSSEVRKTTWSSEEDRIIIDSHLRLGNKWTAISKLLNGRPANAIKNHWNSTLMKEASSSINSVRRERKKKSVRPRTPVSLFMTSSSDASPESPLPTMPFQHPSHSHTVLFNPNNHDNSFFSNPDPLWEDWPGVHDSHHPAQFSSPKVPLVTHHSATTYEPATIPSRLDYNYAEQSPDLSDLETHMNLATTPEMYYWTDLKSPRGQSIDATFTEMGSNLGIYGSVLPLM